jgi:hypothetical protein
MLKASALYIVIIIALVIAVICSSLIVSAYFYKLQYQKKFRYEQLDNNLSSGINILLESADTAYISEKTFSLFNGDADSVSLHRFAWGVYDVGVVRAFIQKDTLFKTFSFAHAIDSAKWAAIYLVDEDRPFSLSGKTTIRGDAYIPKAGVQQAYIDNKAYQGDKRLIIGTKHVSDKKLPALASDRLKQLEQYREQSIVSDSALLKTDSVQCSFLKPTHFINFKKDVETLKNIKIGGNVVLLSDTTLTIDSTAILSNILVFARVIIVKSGFHGKAQLFATDSVSIGINCRFDYPSCAGILRFRPSIVKSQARITIGAHTDFSGILFTYEKTDNPVKPLISVGKYTTVSGQVYAQGILELKDSTMVNGSVFTSRFLYKNTFTLFENYLINTTIDSKALSPYYLTSGLLPVSKKKKKILQWLEAN